MMQSNFVVDSYAQWRVENDLSQDSSFNKYLVSGQHILTPAEQLNR